VAEVELFAAALAFQAGRFDVLTDLLLCVTDARLDSWVGIEEVLTLELANLAFEGSEPVALLILLR
jgi:hypothetical protein